MSLSVPERLLKSSARHSYDPEVDIDWDAPIDPTLWGMQPERTSLYGTELWQGLTQEQRITLSNHEVASIASVGLWFELILMQMMLRDAYDDDPTGAHMHYALTEVADGGGMTERLAEGAAPDEAPETEGARAVVLASGNLGLVYLTEGRGRLTLEEVEALHPDLVRTLIEHDLVDELEDGCVVVFTAPEETKTVGEAVSAALGTQIKTSDIIWDPNEDTKTVIPSEDAAEDLADFVDIMMEEESTVHAISMNVAQGAVSAESWKQLQTRLS